MNQYKFLKKLGIFIADSRKISHFLPKESIDLVITNPPYWNEVVYSKDPGQLSMIEDYNEFIKSISEVWLGCQHVLKEGAILAIWTHDFFRKDNESLVYVPFHSDLIKSMPSEMCLRNISVWDRYLNKNRGPLDASQKISTRFEYILIFQKQGHHPLNNDLIENSLTDFYWNPIWNYKTHPKLFGSRKLFRALFALQRAVPSLGLLRKIANPLLKDDYEFKNYTTECPEEIASHLMQNFTQPGDTVLDPFLGSGTTIKVAQQLNRLCLGVEINKQALTSIQNKLGFLPDISHII